MALFDSDAFSRELDMPRPKKEKAENTDEPVKIADTAAPKKKAGRPPKAAARVVANDDAVKANMALVKDGTFVREMVSDLIAKTGANTVMVGKDLEKTIIGVPLPSLSLQYVFGTSILPLGRIFQLVGAEGTCKSAFAFEMARWILDRSGMLTLIENESKYSGAWLNSIVGKENSNRWFAVETTSTEEWTQRAIAVIQSHYKKMIGTLASPGVGVIYPYIVVIDSISGKMTESQQQKVMDEGGFERGYPVQAKVIQTFLQTVPQMLSPWPSLLVMINHVKKGIGDIGNVPERVKPGGTHKQYQETYELELSKLGALKTTKYEGVKLGFCLYKNGFGTTGRKGRVEVRWWAERESPEHEWDQVTKWCWHASSIDFLESQIPDHKKTAVKDILHVGKVTGGRYYCSALGVKQSDAMSAEDLGNILHQNEAIMREIKFVLGIKDYKVYQPGVDYFQQRFDKPRDPKVLIDVLGCPVKTKKGK